METETMITHGNLAQIAMTIRKDWKNIYFGAIPYLEAMASLQSMKDSYGEDSASTIVTYFLANAQTWRGETARQVKKQLNNLLKSSR